MKYRVKTSIFKDFSFDDIIELTQNGMQYAHKGAMVGDPAISESVIERNPNWFEAVPEVKVGQYWISDQEGFPLPKSEALRISEVCEGYVYYQSINSQSSGNSKEEAFVKHATRLSPEEVEACLIKEAKQRGYRRGLRIISAQYKSSNTIGYPTNGGTGYELNGNYDTFYMGGVAVYCEGQWAEIIKDKWRVVKKKGFGYFVCSKDGKVEMVNGICCLDTKQAEAIANALNELEGV